MAIEYINRKGKKYHLRIGKTKTGNPKYFFSMEEEGVLADSIPDGYEIYENPNAQVFLRRIPLRVFTDEEISIVENGVKNYSNLKDFKVDVKKNAIVVFTPDQDIDSLKDILSENRLFGNLELGRLLEDKFLADPELGPLIKKRLYDNSRLEQKLIKILTYSPMLRFVLVDEKKRKFQVERMCLLDSIKAIDWIFLDSSDNLKGLAKKYCRHLGRDSFYELI